MEILSFPGIPNLVALAHAMTTGSIPEPAICITSSVLQRRTLKQLCDILDTKKTCIEWTGSLSDIRALRDADFSGLLVIDYASVMKQELLDPSDWESAVYTVQPTMAVERSAVEQHLVEYEWIKDASANQFGHFSARGDVLDLFIDRPYRIAFDGDVIESIKPFDLGTGASGSAIDTLTIPPAFAIGDARLLDYIPWDWNVVLYQTDPIHEWTQEQAPRQWRVDSFSGTGELEYEEPRAYLQRYADLSNDISEYEQVTVLTHDPDAVRSALEEQGATPDTVTFTQQRIPSRGMIHRPSKQLIITDADIGLAAQAHQKDTAKLKAALIQQLSPGDYVVHIHHGIARFTGMTSLHVNAMDREYFVLEYAGNDKIYVPVEMADYIESYVGMTDPPLQKLSGASWHEAVAKVKEQALEMARDLLDLYARRSIASSPVMLPQPDQEHAFSDACPFELTSDQVDALQAIHADMQQEEPMDRLLCGDVGFGKTEVALRASLRAVLNNYQVAFLAPTTVLVQQHFDTVSARLKPFGMVVKQLSRFQTPAEQRAILAGLRNGSVDVVVGTHRLLSKDVRFRNVGLIVIDEEQRFGVKAKERLKELRSDAHVLTMTATPIPRTLHLSLSGVRDISTILTAPQDRMAVNTVIGRLKNDTIAEAVERELQRDGQTYYIYNRVESIDRRARELQELLPDARIRIAHGQMSAKELSEVMHAFDIGEVDVLLSTTIVENGLDIANANTLIVENASRFGLAQLYQLKGRVGRSDRQGYAYFLYKERIPDEDVQRRFAALQSASSLGAGFELAMKDMEIRGVGNILGKEQHGHASAIGLHLYLRLLNQAVQTLEGIEEPLRRDVTVDLPLEARIPEGLLPGEADRILLYQQLSALETVEELHAQRDRYASRGPLPAPLSGLFELLEIKILAGRTALVSIDTTYPNDMNRLDAPRITISADEPLPQLPTEWERVYGDEAQAFKARATTAELGDEWIAALKAVLLNLQQSKEAH